jgi:transposase
MTTIRSGLQSAARSRRGRMRFSSSTRPGWHTTRKLNPPSNLTLVPLPPACPELNAAENIWQYLRQTYLANRVFADYTAILDACQDAWRKLLAETGRITSIAQRDWIIIGQSL